MACPVAAYRIGAAFSTKKLAAVAGFASFACPGAAEPLKCAGRMIFTIIVGAVRLRSFLLFAMLIASVAISSVSIVAFLESLQGREDAVPAVSAFAIISAIVAIDHIAVVAFFADQMVHIAIGTSGECAIGIARCGIEAIVITLLSQIDNAVSALRVSAILGAVTRTGTACLSVIACTVSAVFKFADRVAAVVVRDIAVVAFLTGINHGVAARCVCAQCSARSIIAAALRSACAHDIRRAADTIFSGIRRKLY